MPPTFAQAERRNLLVPGIVVAILAIAALTCVWFFAPHRTAEVQITNVAYKSLHTEMPTQFATGPHVVGHADTAQDDIYVLATVRIHDDLTLPLFIKDFTGTLTSPDDSELTTSAVEKNDLDQVYAAVPGLKSISVPPLLREIEIAPDATAQGVVMLHYAVPETLWQQRKSASITIDFYHQDPITVALPHQ